MFDAMKVFLVLLSEAGQEAEARKIRLARDANRV
jgi:hypothetical protein